MLPLIWQVSSREVMAHEPPAHASNHRLSCALVWFLKNWVYRPLPALMQPRLGMLEGKRESGIPSDQRFSNLKAPTWQWGRGC